MKLLAGKPRIVKPSSRFASNRDSSASYCGVSPPFDATLTTSTTLPAWSLNDDAWPSMVVNGISWMSVIAAHHGPGAAWRVASGEKHAQFLEAQVRALLGDEVAARQRPSGHRLVAGGPPAPRRE